LKAKRELERERERERDVTCSERVEEREKQWRREIFYIGRRKSILF